MLNLAMGGPRSHPTTSRIHGRRWRDFDFFMLITTVVLMIFSAFAIWSADGGGSLSFENLGVRQAAFGVIGIVMLLVLASIDYRLFASVAWLLYGSGLAMLGLVLVPGVGTEIGGAQRWFDLFGITTVQPSEFAKLTTIIGLAAFISSRGPVMKEFSSFLLTIVIVAVPMLLIVAQPDLDSALILGVIWLAMMLVTHTRRIYLVGAAIVGPIAAILAYALVLQPYHRERILQFLGLLEDPLGIGYQATQAQLSIGSAGWTGFGLAGGTQSVFNFLAVRESDFVFAHAAAMFGFIGMVALLLAIVILLWRCLCVVEMARDSFGQLLAAGITGILFVQAVVNIGMNVGLLPVAGIPLPFISQGLSSLWAFLFAEGILQSILVHHRKLGFQPE
ncbi:MAG: rod shape-determining protein RodA [Chloroflexota bacterium]|nr:rod shape-determining protein RodA [Chloroflexota bacterium]